MVIRAPGEQAAEADALVSAAAGTALSVLSADCATIAMASPEGVVAAVHAGWRGVADGVVARAAEAMAALGASRVVAAMGPCAHPECYEFSAEDLSELVGVLGPEVAGASAAGRPSFDLPAAVRISAARAGVEMLAGLERCTICSPEYFSHRREASTERQALVVWQS